MKKIPCVFQRDFTNRRESRILPEVTPGCEWVLAGEGVATRKRDGTACLFKDGKLHKRYDAKRGKPPPSGFIPAQDPDPVTGHWPGWLVVDVKNPAPEDVWHALGYWQTCYREDVGQADGFELGARLSGGWTYELCGPRIGTNHEDLSFYEFFEHGRERMTLCSVQDRSFDGLRAFLAGYVGEGIVFWREPGNPNGDMAKLTRENFGFPWPLAPVAK